MERKDKTFFDMTNILGSKILDVTSNYGSVLSIKLENSNSIFMDNENWILLDNYDFVCSSSDKKGYFFHFSENLKIKNLKKLL